MNAGVTVKTLVIANQKGGVGKSALVTQLALYAGKQGLRTLVIDLDHQANTSNALKKSACVGSLDHPSSRLLYEPHLALKAPNIPISLAWADEGLGTLERQSDAHNTVDYVSEATRTIQ